MSEEKKKKNVLLVDELPTWVRHPRDAVASVVMVLLIFLIIALAVYGHSTFVAVRQDVVRGFPGVVLSVAHFPVAFVTEALVLLLPIYLVGVLLRYKKWRALITSVVASLLSYVAGHVYMWVMLTYFPYEPFVSFIDTSYTFALGVTSLLPVFASLSAVMTVSSSFVKTRYSWWMWIFLIVIAFANVLQMVVTMAGVLVSLLIGACIGYLVRYLMGSEVEKAVGGALVAMVRSSCIEPQRIVRLDDVKNIHVWNIATPVPLGYYDSHPQKTINSFMERAHSSDDILRYSSVSASDEDAKVYVDEARRYKAVANRAAARHYLVYGYDEEKNADVLYEMSVFDSERQVVSVLTRMWHHIKYRTVIRRVDPQVDNAVEHAYMMELAAINIGVRSSVDVRPIVSRLSTALLCEYVAKDSLDEKERDELTNAHLDAIWHSMKTAHIQGLTHGYITDEYITFEGEKAYIEQWASGNIGSTAFARTVDRVQLLTLLACHIGEERAVESAVRALGKDIVMSLAPFMQRTLIPHAIRKRVDVKKLVEELRSHILEFSVESESNNQVQIRRFSMKTVMTVLVGIIVVYVILGSINWDDMKNTVLRADARWLIAGFAASLLTYFGSGVMLKAYTAEPLKIGESSTVQLAASVISVIAPAGIGHAALNLRFLQKKKVSTAIAVATVSLVQIAQFVTTLVFLGILMLVSHEVVTFSLPTGTIISLVMAVLAGVILTSSVKPLRQKILSFLKPYVEQIVPRLVWLLTHPERIVYGLLGSLVLTAGYIATFGFSLAAFGYSLSIFSLSVTYLVSNSLGALVPSPGGIGPVEGALTAGLVVAGIPYSVALSSALVYRLLTFWLPVPLGWLALRYIQKKNLV
ncbi:MAG: flippase-like domain-containing protein [Actinomycetaceae bacterium]|nr:flippase-like domain-containing protein [Actinomycetaceae bacterium]